MNLNLAPLGNLTKPNEFILIDSLKYPLITEKANELYKKNWYSFLVDKQMDKTSIKTAFEYLFKVKVVKIHTTNLPRRQRRVNKYIGYRPLHKKAIIKLSPTDSLDFFRMERTSLGI
uniref:Ribosomal protein L23 n=1 Tax=Eustigmatophyceae sp. Ndem 8/9T-3m6.8 TaxID=2506146 RepID=A0A410D256_9STRA|nr:ribosomal protein L23 [Eustigmatophyceae sp. Ndem 8/9T-3m6.8]QAA11817.1 ribosomal protein L23 [Eustigmatophyceae sp. Ndem 8/9T-3m6.8]